MLVYPLAKIRNKYASFLSYLSKRGVILFNLIRATRIERSLYAVGSIIVTAAILDSFSLEVAILMLNSILLYCVGGLINAKKDNDYNMGKKNIDKYILFLFIVASLLSLQSLLLLLSTIIWFLFGFVYNHYSRKILMMDSFVLSITHVVVPGVFTFLILGSTDYSVLFILIFLAIVFFLLITMKNINQKNEDLQRGYLTLMTCYRKGFYITICLYLIAIFLMILTPVIFGFYDLNYLAPSTLSLSCVPFFVIMLSGDLNLPVQIMRITWFIYIFIVTFMFSSNPYFLLGAFGVMLIHFMLFNKNIILRLHNGV